MQQNGGRFILTLLASITLFITGIYLYGSVAEFLLPDVNGVFYQVTEFGSPFTKALIFSFILALIPVCINITWAIGRARNYQERFTIASIIIVITLLTVFVRHQVLYFHLKSLSEELSADAAGINMAYPLNETNFELYMLAGLLGGCVITAVIYLRKK